MNFNVKKVRNLVVLLATNFCNFSLETYFFFSTTLIHYIIHVYPVAEVYIDVCLSRTDLHVPVDVQVD